MQLRTQRKSRYQPFVDIHTPDVPGADVITFVPGVLNATLGIFPRFGSPFPDVKSVEVPVRFVKTASPFPISLAGARMFELRNERFCVFCVSVWGGLLSPADNIEVTGDQCVGIVTKSTGEVLRVVVGNSDPMHESLAAFSEFVLMKNDFDENAKAIDAKSLKTQINPVNEDDLTHTWEASITAPNGAVHKIGGSVKELKEAGATVAKSFNYWQKGWSWAIGDRVGVIGKNFDGVYHIAVFSKDGEFKTSSKSTNYQSAIS